MTIAELLNKLRSHPEQVAFEEVMAVIDRHYVYTPTRFRNGALINEAGSNEGSCRLFYFAQLHKLSEMETLALFGKYYREDVMGNPNGKDHANIRNFILDGWAAIRFQGVALKPRVVH